MVWSDRAHTDTAKRLVYAPGLLQRKGEKQVGFFFKGEAKHPAVCAVFWGVVVRITILRNEEGKVWQQIRKSESS